MNSDTRRKRTSAPYVAVSMTAGVAFAIVALLHLRGVAYVIVAIVAGLCYSLLTLANRRRDDQ